MRDINRPILVVAIPLLVLSTAVSQITSYIQCHLLKPLKHKIVDMVRVENGFVKYRDTFPGWASGILRRCYPTPVCGQKFRTRVSNLGR